ncbi:MAG: ABC transporter ATP-binding protein [Patescibacteria group bacterium]
MIKNILSLKNINKTYLLTKNNQVIGVKNINLTIKTGEFVAITGPSGSGKSTLLNLIGLLDLPDNDQGELQINDQNIKKFGASKIAKLRRETIGFIFQTFNLLPRLSAIENIQLPLRYNNQNNSTSRTRALELLKKVGLEKRGSHKPAELSGGERQRVAIARALANEPKIILADEPTGNLDSASGTDIMNLLKKLNKENDVTLIIVTHDQSIARQADRIISLKDGQLC